MWTCDGPRLFPSFALLCMPSVPKDTSWSKIAECWNHFLTFPFLNVKIRKFTYWDGERKFWGHLRNPYAEKCLKHWHILAGRSLLVTSLEFFFFFDSFQFSFHLRTSFEKPLFYITILTRGEICLHIAKN